MYGRLYDSCTYDFKRDLDKFALKTDLERERKEKESAFIEIN